MNKYLLLLFLFSAQMPARSQAPGFPFTLEGTINTDTGTMQLSPLGDRAYNVYHPEAVRMRVEKGGFVLRDTVSCPTAYRLLFFRGNELTYVSDFFLLDSGFQTVRCNVDSLRERPVLINASSAESGDYYDRVLTGVHKIAAENDEESGRLQARYGKNIPDSLRMKLDRQREYLAKKKCEVLWNYSDGHPLSYVALWELIRQMNYGGYQPVFDSVYARFSTDIKNSHPGKMLGEKLHTAKSTAVGGVFPRLPLSTIAGGSVSVPVVGAEEKYLFVDFWYSHCGPCISEFGALKKIYALYHPKGFAMLGISVDKKQFVGDWKAAIRKYRLPWKQYLDLEGREASKLSIGVTPSNFLLDKQGKIIARDLSPAALDSFLRQQLRASPASVLHKMPAP